MLIGGSTAARRIRSIPSFMLILPKEQEAYKELAMALVSALNEDAAKAFVDRWVRESRLYPPMSTRSLGQANNLSITELLR